jgi:hypothetical protein
MSRPRFRPTDAFVDESIRGSRYLMACVLVDAAHLARIRRLTKDFAGNSKRLHFHQELDSRRRGALELFVSMPLRVSAVVCVRGIGISEFQARAAGLAELVNQLQARSVSRLTIESRQDDNDDRRTISRAREHEPPLVFDHRKGESEPLLSIADAFAWSVGACGRWQARVEGVLDPLIELRP